MKNYVETIIVGGGISGLACARELQDNNKDFLLISKDIGGRILTSNDGNVNYGAYLVCSYYKHIKPYVEITRPVYPTNFNFHLNKKSYSFFSKKLIKYFPELLRFLRILRKFKKEYYKLKEKEAYYPQKKLIEDNEYLHYLYNKSAREFVKENRIENIVDQVVAEPIFAISFSSINDAKAFPFLHATLLLMSNIHEFNFLFEKLLKGFEDKMHEGEVSKIEKVKDEYKIYCNDSIYYCRNLVLALPIKESSKLVGVPEVNKDINVHMYHVNGKIKKSYSDKEFQLFSPKSDLETIAHQHDGTYLVYSRNPIDLRKVFSVFHIIKHIPWEPAFTVPGPHLQEQKIGKNLYLAGDFNLGAMEDTFLTGLYAANCILKKNKD